jgi:hypothetical protein
MSVESLFDLVLAQLSIFKTFLSGLLYTDEFILPSSCGIYLYILLLQQSHYWKPQCSSKNLFSSIDDLERGRGNGSFWGYPIKPQCLDELFVPCIFILLQQFFDDSNKYFIQRLNQ